MIQQFFKSRDRILPKHGKLGDSFFSAVIVPAGQVGQERV
jgi:hypothetical protein